MAAAANVSIKLESDDLTTDKLDLTQLQQET
jgi:hypothetical protein